MRYILTILFMTFSLSTLAEDTDFRQISQMDTKNIRVVTMTNIPEGTVRQSGPILFYSTKSQWPLAESVDPILVSLMAGDGFTPFNIKGIAKEAQKQTKNLRWINVGSSVLFNGSWSDFLQKNQENSDKNGKDFDGRGLATAAVQTLMLGVSLLAGAPVTAVANAGLTGTYGTFSKEDTQWFQSIQIDPQWESNPPESVAIIKTCLASEKGRVKTCVWSLVMGKKGSAIGNEINSQTIAQSVHNGFSKLFKVEATPNEDELKILAELDQVKIAANSASQPAQ